MELILNETMKDYRNWYLKCDVLLLTDVSEKLRNNSKKNYAFTSMSFFGAAAWSWDAMLNMTKVNPKLTPDLNMYIFFEKGMRGGVSYISNRYSKACWLYMYLKSYDSKQESKHIIYLDTSNLYGYAISKLLLTSALK